MKQLKLTWPDYVLVVLLLWHFVSNIAWIFLTTAPLPWDQAGHTRLAIQFADYFRSFGFLRITDYFTISTYYPPLIHTIVGFFVIIFGHPIITSELIITMFFLASIVLLYIYTIDLFGNKRLALLTAAMYSFFPIIVEHSRWFMLEIPMVAMYLLGLIFLHRSQNFQNTKHTYRFFITLGLGLMTKWLIAVYFLVPLGLALFRWLQQPKTVKQVEAILWGIVICVAIAAPWYLINLDALTTGATTYVMPEASSPQHLTDPTNFGFYFYLLTNFQITIYGIILAIAGSIVYLLAKRPHKFLVYGTLASIYLVFSFILNKNARYTIGMLPFLAIIIGIALDRLWQWQTVIGGVVSSVVIGLFGCYIFILSFRYPIAKPVYSAINLPVLGWTILINVNDNLVHSYDNAVWPQVQILQTIASQETGQSQTFVLCLIDQEHFNYSDTNLIKNQLGLQNVIIDNAPATDFSDVKSAEQFLLKYDYVFVPEQQVGVAATRNLAIRKQLIDLLKNDKMIVVSSVVPYNLPTGDRVLLFHLYHANQ